MLESIKRQTEYDPKYEYDPRHCSNLVGGHCDDEDGGAWTYRIGSECTYAERSPLENNAPMDRGVVPGLPNIFPDIQSVMDFGGGVGVYLTGFRNKGINSLVTVEPVPLGSCLFAGIAQDSSDWMNTPLSKLPSGEFDLVMTIEAAEHIPVRFHPHLIQALAQATSQWLLFSAARPEQPGEGHVGPSMKMRKQWVHEIESLTSLRVDVMKTQQLHDIAGQLLRMNGVIFRKD